MGKKVNFLVVFIIMLLLVAGNVLFYFNKMGVSISGFSVTEFPISDFIVKIKKPDLSTIIFLAQWFLLLIVILIFYIKFLRERKHEKITSNIPIIPRKGTETGTDLDALYNVLQKKGKLKVSDIAKSFRINNERALDWGKILENNELVSIDYPAFSEPEIKIKRGENEEKQKEERIGRGKEEEKSEEASEEKRGKKTKSKKERKK